ncbi:MAG: hypothetical protein Q9195_004211 [Heterodermia aff. obscurata]
MIASQRSGKQTRSDDTKNKTQIGSDRQPGNDDATMSELEIERLLIGLTAKEKEQGMVRKAMRTGAAISAAAEATEVKCLEGSWDEVMRLIGQAHVMLHHQGIVRIQTDIRVGSRTDKKQSFGDKVKAVEDLLAKDEK